MDATDFDPRAPLPGPPDPWASTDTPSHRDGPPFHMTEMIAAEPYLAERLLGRLADPAGSAATLAGAIRDAVAAGTQVVITGCGTSEHGALAIAEILREATGSHLITSEQAFELAAQPPSSGLVVGISHEGATGATNAALSASRAAGAATALITVSGRSLGAALVDIVIETGELDQGWCHTVGYVSPIVAGTAVGGHVSGSAGTDAAGAGAGARAAVSGAVARDILASGLTPSATAAAEAIAAALAGVDRVLVLGSGADRPAGRELVLKIEEGAWLPAAYRDLETFLHGHLAATDVTTGLVVVATDRRARPTRVSRVRGALAAARVIGMPTAAIATAGVDALLPAELTSAGRIVVAEAPASVPAAVAALLGSATALQTLTERLARARGINPDPIHRDVDRYRAAADAADAAAG